VGRAAVGEEEIGLRIGVLAERFDPRQPGLREPRDDEAFEVELVVAGSPLAEEALVFRVGFGEAAEEAVVHFIGLAGDARADRGGDPFALRAEPFHRRDGRFDDSGKGAFPARMGGADHPGVPVGEQNRRAVRSEDSQREARPVGHDRIGPRTRIVRPARLGDDDVRGVHLMDGHQLRPGRDRLDGAAAVLDDRLAVVA
jgi:hypothetical protein